jgi:hypothetical protein
MKSKIVYLNIRKDLQQQTKDNMKEIRRKRAVEMGVPLSKYTFGMLLNDDYKVNK